MLVLSLQMLLKQPATKDRTAILRTFSAKEKEPHRQADGPKPHKMYKQNILMRLRMKKKIRCLIQHILHNPHNQREYLNMSRLRRFCAKCTRGDIPMSIWRNSKRQWLMMPKY